MCLLEHKNREVSDLKKRFINAINKLYQEDRNLIDRGVHEITISHRLAFYLEEIIEKAYRGNFKADIEYNKNMDDQKCLVEGERGKKPDIIVHKRKSNDNNLIIVELKKNKAVQEDDNDDRKLKGATREDYTFQYELGVYVNLKPDKVIISWYEKGNKTDNQTFVWDNQKKHMVSSIERTQ